VDTKTTRINVVLAADGYPEAPKKGADISGLEHLDAGVDYFHAGTKKDDGNWIVNGGRVLNVLGKGHDIDTARADAYAKIEKLGFAGMQFRKDIGKTEN
jgi:phosphoribosylamine--glycine ligase